MADLVEGLRSCNWCGSITGPHGSGKSTLLTALDAALRQAGCAVERINAAQPAALALRSLALDGGGGPRLLLVDGYDLYAAWKRWCILRRCRRMSVGLVATSHRPVGLPLLIETSTSTPLAVRLANTLAGKQLSDRDEELIREAFARHGGNLREVWFDLYDRYEQCHRPVRGVW